MKIPKVSVIMPAYNHEDYVGEAIESVLNQTFADFEFIIINDGSTDGTERVIKTYDDPRIGYYYQENIDAPKTLNRGLSLARGKYISIINSDDVYHPKRLSCLVEKAEAHDARFAITNVAFIDESSDPITDRSHRTIAFIDGLNSLYRVTKSLKRTFLAGNIAVTTSNFFFHNEVAQTVGSFSSYRYTHDYNYVVRTLAKYPDRFLFINDMQYIYYRLHSKSTTGEAPLKARVETMGLLMEIIPEFMNNEEDKALVDTLLHRIKYFNGQIVEPLIYYEGTVIWKIIAPLRWFARWFLRKGISKRVVSK